MAWFLCSEIVIPFLCSILLGMVFVRFLMAVIGQNVEEKDKQIYDEPSIEIDPAKALAKQVKFMMRMKRQMRRFKARKSQIAHPSD